MLWSAFLLGLISSLHCAGMCGPLQAVALGALRQRAGKGYIALYHLNRIFTYGVLGLLAGLLGKGIGLQNWQQHTSLLSGLLLLLAFAGFYLLKVDKQLLRLMLPLLNRLRSHLQKNRSAKALYFSGSGVINGLLPCGMVYLAIFPALGSPDLLSSFGYMLLFGAGTLPLLLVLNFGTLNFLQSRGKMIRRLIPAMVIITALLLILRGMNLGIPYLSPAAPVSGASVEICH